MIIGTFAGFSVAHRTGKLNLRLTIKGWLGAVAMLACWYCVWNIRVYECNIDIGETPDYQVRLSAKGLATTSSVAIVVAFAILNISGDTSVGWPMSYLRGEWSEVEAILPARGVANLTLAAIMAIGTYSCVTRAAERGLVTGRLSLRDGVYAGVGVLLSFFLVCLHSLDTLRWPGYTGAGATGMQFGSYLWSDLMILTSSTARTLLIAAFFPTFLGVFDWVARLFGNGHSSG